MPSMHVMHQLQPFSLHLAEEWFRWPATGPKVSWRANVGTGFSSLAIADGQLFTLGNEDTSGR